MKKEMFWAFQITRTIIFEVSYYTLGSNPHPYFSTCASQFNQPKTDWCQCGQAQKDLLPKLGPAYKFYLKWDKFHCEDLPQDKYDEMVHDIGILKRYYTSFTLEAVSTAGYRWGHIPFHNLKDMSMTPIKTTEVRAYQHVTGNEIEVPWETLPKLERHQARLAIEMDEI